MNKLSHQVDLKSYSGFRLNMKLKNPTITKLSVWINVLLSPLLFASCHTAENFFIEIGKFKENLKGNKIKGIIRDYDTDGIIKDVIVYPVHISEAAKPQDKYKADVLGYFEFNPKVGKVEKLIVETRNFRDTVEIFPGLNFYYILIKDPKQNKSTDLDKVADMHYHVSMKPYNEYSGKYLSNLDPFHNTDNGLWTFRKKKLKVLFNGDNKRLMGKWKKPGHLRKINTDKFHEGKKRELKKFTKLNNLYSGNWYRDGNDNNKFLHYTQATLPHLKKGNVRLAFNSISPIEFNITNSPKIRIINSGFKSNAKLRWLKEIGSYRNNNKANPFRLTHFENLNRELSLLKEPKEHFNDLPIKILRSGEQLKNDQNSFFVVNSLEGGHSLQGKHAMLETLNIGERDLDIRKNKMRMFIERELKHIEEFNITNTRIRAQVAAIRNNNDPKQSLRKTKSIPLLKQKREETHKLLNSLIQEELKENIKYLKKNQETPVFMVTIAHLAWNGMVPHARALDTKGLGRLLIKRIYRIKDSDDLNVSIQRRALFYTEELNENGKLMINELLSKENGRRILIDLKHSDYSMRKYFYENIMSPRISINETARMRAKDKPIPPICSHCAVNGLQEIDHSKYVDEYAKINSPLDDIFYPFGMNLYDDEIRIICSNNGIIGIPLEQRVLGGLMKPERILAIKNKFDGLSSTDFEKYFGSALEYNREIMEIRDRSKSKRSKKVLLQDYLSLEPFMQNLFHIIDNSGKSGEEAWKHVCIGSDLDGIIDPIDICPTASQYPHMRKRLEQFIPFFLKLRQENNQLKEEKMLAAKGLEKYFDYTVSHSSDCKEHPKAAFCINKALSYLFYDSLKDFVITNFD